MTRARPPRHLLPLAGLSAGLTAGLTLAVSLVPWPAAAQAPVAEDRAVTQGIDRPIHDVAGAGDASSAELNPALLTAVRGLDLVFRGYDTVSDFARGSGFGGWFSINPGIGFALGFGAQTIRPGLGGGQFDAQSGINPAITKYSFTFAGGTPDVGGFGVGVHGSRINGQRLQSPDLDIGTLWRITNFASLGLRARLSPGDLGNSQYPAEVDLLGEVAVRPLGTRRLELATGLRARVRDDQGGSIQDAFNGFSSNALLPRGRMALRFQGWSLQGQVEQIDTVVLDEQTLLVTGTDKGLRGSVALGMSWDFVTAEGGAVFGGTEAVDGWGLMARMSTDRQGRIYPGRILDAEKIDVAEIRDERDLIAMLERIERAEKAGPRAVLVIDARGVSAGWASLYELREALVRVRNAGGHVFAYTELADMQDYYIASVAEQIYVHQAGELGLFGLSATGLYFKDALSKIGVNVEALHIREYKAAHEPFTRRDRSAADREQRSALLDDVWDQFIDDVARARGLTRAQVRDLIDHAPYGPQAAVDAGLADEIVYRDEIEGLVSEHIGSPVEFAEFTNTAPSRPTWSAEPYVAVVLVEGTIVDGESLALPFFNIRNAGGDTIARTLRELRGDRQCRGIVLRVNSPGGSALASDIIWREVDRTRAEHAKDPRAPAIVVSMGDVAASGGYYVSMGADHVFAQPTTITGSIGVVALHFDVSGLLRMLGINTDTIKRGELAGLQAPWAPYSPEAREALEGSMQRTYDLFRKRVAKGRNISIEKVDELGRGHVYSGEDALALGLVDEMGGLPEAIAWIEDEMDLPRRRDTRVRVFPSRFAFLDLLLDRTGPGISEPAGKLAERSRKRRARRGKGPDAKKLPPALDAAVARLPLSVLLVGGEEIEVLMPGEIRIE